MTSPGLGVKGPPPTQQHPQPQGPLQPGSRLDGQPGGGQWPFSWRERLCLKTNKRLPGQRAEKWFQRGVWAARRPFSQARWAVRRMAENQSRAVCVCRRTCVAVTAAGAPGEAPWGHVSTTWAPTPAEPGRCTYRSPGPSPTPTPSLIARVGAHESRVSLRVSQILVVSS